MIKKICLWLLKGQLKRSQHMRQIVFGMLFDSICEQYYEDNKQTNIATFYEESFVTLRLKELDGGFVANIGCETLKESARCSS
jgi:hypothetical protein